MQFNNVVVNVIGFLSDAKDVVRRHLIPIRLCAKSANTLTILSERDGIVCDMISGRKNLNRTIDYWFNITFRKSRFYVKL